jgi:hypothetical protein
MSKCKVDDKLFLTNCCSVSTLLRVFFIYLKLLFFENYLAEQCILRREFSLK